MSYLVKKGAVRGIFGECRGPAHNGLVHAVTVIRHAHSTLVQVHLLLQQSALTGNVNTLVKKNSIGHNRHLKVLMGPYSWPDRGSYCYSSEPPQQGLSVTDGTTEAFQGPFDCMHHPLYETKTFSIHLNSKL